MECSYHLSGRYPEWWTGHRFHGPIRMWATGQTNESTRDNVQLVLAGAPEEPGTGTLAAGDIVKITRAPGIPDAYDKITVRHVSGGISTVLFKSYEQGKLKWAGPNIDFVWFDEEPDEDIYTEGLARTNKVKGLTVLTFTPIIGQTKVVSRFWPRPQTRHQHLTMMQMDDADHFRDDPELKAEALDMYPEHEKEARDKGIPVLGEGKVFKIPEELWVIPPIEIPSHFSRIGGIDFGFTHPTSLAWLAYDRDADVIYVTEDYRVPKLTHVEHAPRMQRQFPWMPWAWPKDGKEVNEQTAVPMMTAYENEGVYMLPEHSSFENGGVGIEAGIDHMIARKKHGRLKVFSTCYHYIEESRNYHRKKGKVVQVFDDTICAVRYGLMSIRHAEIHTPDLLQTRATHYRPFSRYATNSRYN